MMNSILKGFLNNEKKSRAKTFIYFATIIGEKEKKYFLKKLTAQKFYDFPSHEILQTYISLRSRLYIYPFSCVRIHFFGF